MPFEADAPKREAVLATPTPVAVLEQQAYVYLLRVVEKLQLDVLPKAKIPLVLFPEADPSEAPVLAAVAEALVLEEYVYLFLVLGWVPIFPKWKIPIVLVPAADPLQLVAEAQSA